MRLVSMTAYKKHDRIRSEIRMGIFDKKNKGKRTQDFDSPVEKIELKAKPTPAPKESAEAEEPKVANKNDPEPTVVIKNDPEPSSETPEATKPNTITNEQHYGIEEAIALIRTLPTENVELVTRVVKQTLESTHIDIPTIILDATAKQERIDTLIAKLKAEIAEREAEIAERQEEIEVQQSDLSETAMVKQRLEHAVSLSTSDTATKKKPEASAK